MSINNVGGCCFIFHRLVNKDYDWDSLVQFVMHYSFIIMQELLLPIRQQPPEFMNIRNYVRNALSDITRNWLSKMEISNVFPLISNFVFELSLFVVVDGAVKFLQNTRLLWINFGYLFRVRYCTVWLNTAKDRKGALRAKLQEIGTNWTQWCLVFQCAPRFFTCCRTWLRTCALW